MKDKLEKNQCACGCGGFGGYCHKTETLGNPTKQQEFEDYARFVRETLRALSPVGGE